MSAAATGASEDVEICHLRPYGSFDTIRTMTTTDTEAADETASQRHLRQTFAEGLATVGRIYGLNPVLSHLYAALFVSPVPLTLEQAAAQAGVAKSTASVSLRTLERLFLVRRAPKRPGDRRDAYEPVTDLAAIVSEWLRTFVAREIEAGAVVADDVSAALDAALNDHDAKDAAVIKGRVDGFIRMTRLAERAYKLAVATGVSRIAEVAVRFLSR